MDKDLEEIKEPIGHILIEHKIPFVQHPDGAYYHYSNVCRALKIAEEKSKSEARKEILEKLKGMINVNRLTSFDQGYHNALSEVIFLIELETQEIK